MEIVEGKWFRLPRLGVDDFKTLMSLGVKYDKSKGMMINYETNKKLLVEFLENVLNDKIILYKECGICGKNIDCRSCEYSLSCDYYKVSEKCVCDECMTIDESYAFYIMQ
ncbi:MAG: hypothetical protein QXG36_01480 [Nitrososphaeria archaeon]